MTKLTKTETKLAQATEVLQSIPLRDLRARYAPRDAQGAIKAAAKYAAKHGEDFYAMPVYQGSWALAAESRSESDITFPGTYFRVTPDREVYMIVATY